MDFLMDCFNGFFYLMDFLMDHAQDKADFDANLDLSKQ